MTDEIKDVESATVPDLSKPISEPTIEERVSAFNVDLKELLKKHNMVLLAEPRIFNGIIVADPKVIAQEQYDQLVKGDEAIK